MLLFGLIDVSLRVCELPCLKQLNFTISKLLFLHLDFLYGFSDNFGSFRLSNIRES